MVSDQYVQKLFDKFIDQQILNFNEDDMMTSLVDFEEKPLFPGEDDRTRETQSLTQNRQSIKDLKNAIGSRFAGLKPLTKGKLANVGRKLKAAKLAISLNESKRDSISMDVTSMLDKFFTQNTQHQFDVTQYKPQSKYGSTHFRLSQISPMLQTIIDRESYKKIHEGARNMFGVSSSTVLKGMGLDELAVNYEK